MPKSSKLQFGEDKMRLRAFESLRPNQKFLKPITNLCKNIIYLIKNLDIHLTNYAKKTKSADIRHK